MRALQTINEIIRKKGTENLMQILGKSFFIKRGKNPVETKTLHYFKK